MTYDCGECGSVVSDQNLHTEFHYKLGHIMNKTDISYDIRDYNGED